MSLKELLISKQPLITPIITITDLNGNVIAWASAGSSFRGSRKSTPFAAQQTAETCARPGNGAWYETD